MFTVALTVLNSRQSWGPLLGPGLSTSQSFPVITLLVMTGTEQLEPLPLYAPPSVSILNVSAGV